MKYFENLPKTNFETTIGSFSISNFFTYIDANSATIDESNVTIDNKTTLLEAAYTVYGDINSFWMFVLANSTINPFTLLAQNSTIFVTENKDKTTLSLTKDISGTTSYTFPKGSIVLPYVSNSGGSYSYSSVGNFDLNGPLSIIETASFFTQRMTIKDQKGGTYSFISQDGLTGSQIVVIYQTEGGTYAIQKQFLPYNTKSSINETVKVEISAEAYIEELPKPTSSRPSGKTKGSSTPAVAASVAPENQTEVTAIQEIETKSKTISAYIPISTGTLKTLFTTAKYS